MLTLLLIVVLSAAIAFLAVAEAERGSKGATNGRESDRGDDTSSDAAVAERAEPEPVAVEPIAPPAAVVVREPVTATAIAPPPLTERRPPPAKTAARRPPAGPQWGQPGDAPRRQTAIEGTFAQVGRAPLWRRLLSLIGLIVVIGVIAIGAAAVLGVVAAVLNELLTSAL